MVIIGGLVLALAPIAATGAMTVCEYADGQAAVMACVNREANRARIQLASAEAELNEAMARWDEDPVYVAAGKRAARAARVSYVANRTAQCAFNMALVGGGAGNARRMAGRSCEADLDDARTAQLRAIVARLPRR